MNNTTLLSFEANILGFLKKHYITFIRVSIAVIFIWFGFLKLIDISPAKELVTDTITFLPEPGFYFFLSVWEIVIGLCFLFPNLTRIGFWLFFLHIGGTFLPLILLPDATFTQFPHGLTLEGQYIVKNLVLIGSVITVWIDHKEKSINF